MITQALVKEHFNYKDGNLIWKKPLSNRAQKGSVAGHKSSTGYVRINFYNKKYLGHRLIWLYTYGYLPENDIDHIDRDPSNNRIENLREVSRQCNMRNTGNPSDNTSGMKGICWAKHTKRWLVRITINHKDRHLGYFKSFEEAICHRLAAEQCIGWAGCDDNSPAYIYVTNKKR